MGKEIGIDKYVFLNLFGIIYTFGNLLKAIVPNPQRQAQVSKSLHNF